MSEEKILNDVSEVEDAGYLECYMRFNDDSEKDYCFQVKVTDSFNDLFYIFDTLPIALRPSLFYNSRPLGFKISTAPGYMTEDGALIFDYNATSSKYLKSVSLDDKISDKIWPGQLIVPVWEHKDFAFYTFVTTLAVWLYTDLPDFISPTPGICLTNQMSLVASKLFCMINMCDLGEDLVKDISAPVGIGPQLVFFGFHTLKVLVIFAFFNLGLFNPIKLIKFIGPKPPTDINKDQLLEMGWTGSKRATIDEYKEYYRDYRIKQYKSTIEAHQDGLFERLTHIGVQLEDGEGFNTPVDNKSTLKDLITPPIKFSLNYPYLAKLGMIFEDHISQDGVDATDAVKQFRRYGLIKHDDVIDKIVQTRKRESYPDMKKQDD